jgi:hypothetical protein
MDSCEFFATYFSRARVFGFSSEAVEATTFIATKFGASRKTFRDRGNMTPRHQEAKRLYKPIS